MHVSMNGYRKVWELGSTGAGWPCHGQKSCRSADASWLGRTVGVSLVLLRGASRRERVVCHAQVHVCNPVPQVVGVSAAERDKHAVQLRPVADERGQVPVFDEDDFVQLERGCFAAASCAVPRRETGALHAWRYTLWTRGVIRVCARMWRFKLSGRVLWGAALVNRYTVGRTSQ